MSWSLINAQGKRKYLTADERASFIRSAFAAEPIRGSFCLTLALTGARISEVLALTRAQVDMSENVIVIETLKRRQKGIFRAVPVPRELIEYLDLIHLLRRQPNAENSRLWNFSRPTAWKYVKDQMFAASVPEAVAKPKALRHAFGVEAVQRHISLSLVRKWLGHAKIETTAIYADPVGEEERTLAALMWDSVSMEKAALQTALASQADQSNRETSSK